MALSWQVLKYGVTVISGVSLVGGAVWYVTTRPYVEQVDEAELLAGVIERCYATQYTTNGAGAPVYRVDPPSLVETFYDEANGVEIRANSIGWYVNGNIKMASKIRDLVPWYYDPTNADAFGSFSNAADIPALTVTNLFARLGIGDGTNKFSYELSNSPYVSTIHMREMAAVLSAMRYAKGPASVNSSWAYTTNAAGTATNVLTPRLSSVIEWTPEFTYLVENHTNSTRDCYQPDPTNLTFTRPDIIPTLDHSCISTSVVSNAVSFTFLQPTIELRQADDSPRTTVTTTVFSVATPALNWPENEWYVWQGAVLTTQVTLNAMTAYLVGKDDYALTNFDLSYTEVDWYYGTNFSVETNHYSACGGDPDNVWWSYEPATSNNVNTYYGLPEDQIGNTALAPYLGAKVISTNLVAGVSTNIELNLAPGAKAAYAVDDLILAQDYFDSIGYEWVMFGGAGPWYWGWSGSDAYTLYQYRGSWTFTPHAVLDWSFTYCTNVVYP